MQYYAKFFYNGKAVNKIDNFAVIAPRINDLYDNKKIEYFGNLSLFKFYYNKFFNNIQKNDNVSQNLKQVFL